MMCRAYRMLLVFLSLLVASSVFAQDAGPDTIYERFKSYQTDMGALFPREEGSETELMLRKLIKKRLYELGIPYEDSPIELEGFSSFSRNIVAKVGIRNPLTISIIVPVNTSYNMLTAEYHYASVAFALMLLEDFAKDVREGFNLQVLFAGAENSSLRHAGTLAYMEEIRTENNLIAIYLDMEDLKREIKLYHTGAIRKAPAWLLSSFIDSADYAGTYAAFSSSSIYQLVSNIYTDATPYSAILSRFYKEEIPALAVASNPYGKRQNKEEKRLVEEAYTMLKEGIIRAAKRYDTDWQNHYLVVRLPYIKYFIIEELYYSIFIFAGIFIISIVLFLSYKSTRRYFKAISKSYISLIILFILTLFLLAASSLTSAIISYKGYPGYMQDRLTDFVVLKLSVSVFLFSLFIWLTHILPIKLAENNHFYTATALMFLAIDMAIFGSVLLPLALFFLWAIVCVLFFSISRRVLTRLIFFILSPIWFIRAFFIMITEARQLAPAIISPPFTGDLFLAFLLLPFFLLLIRLDIYIHERRRGKRGRLLGIIMGISLIASVFLTSSLLLSPVFDKKNKQPVELYTLVSDSTKRTSINIESPGFLPDMSIKYGNTYKGIKAKRIKKLSFSVGDEVPEIITYDYKIKSFLGKKLIRIYIDSKSPIDSINIKVTSTGDIPVLDCNFPYTFTGNNTAVISIGKNPPLPLEIVVGVKANSKTRFFISSTTRDIALPVEINAQNISLKSYGKHTKVLDL